MPNVNLYRMFKRKFPTLFIYKYNIILGMIGNPLYVVMMKAYDHDSLYTNVYKYSMYSKV